MTCSQPLLLDRKSTSKRIGERTITTLPVDILFAVFNQLSIPDILSLKKTCRAFYDIGCSDHLWHQLMARLANHIPVNVDLERISQMSAKSLQNLAVRAVQLECNWHRHELSVKSIIEASSGATSYNAAMNRSLGIPQIYFDHIQILANGKWLVGMQRARHAHGLATSVSVWDLNDLCHIRKVSFELPGTVHHFDAAISPLNPMELFLAVALVLSGPTELVVLSLPLTSILTLDATLQPRTILTIKGPPSTASFSGVSIRGSIIAAVLAHCTPNTCDSLLLSNIITGETLVCELKLPAVSNELHRARVEAKLRDTYVVICARYLERFSISVFCLPAELLSEAISAPANTENAPPVQVFSSLPTFNLTEAVREYCSPVYRFFPDFVLWKCGQADLHGIIVSFPHLQQAHADAFAQLYSLDLLPSSSKPVLEMIQGVDVPFCSGVTVSNAHVTSCGRAILLERHWDDDDMEKMRLVRLIPPAVRASIAQCHHEHHTKWQIQRLLPQSLTLPFSPEDVHTLAFDEINGRLCLGLRKGGLWILDFS